MTPVGLSAKAIRSATKARYPSASTDADKTKRDAVFRL